MAAIILLLLSSLLLAHGYKIKRTDCRLNDLNPLLMHCTCGGIGDPFSIILNKGPKPDLGVPYYGTRYGHNLPQQIKQKMLDLNVTQVTRVLYENCTEQALRIKIDFSDFLLDPIFQKDLTSLEEIVFSDVHSINLYLKSAMDWGNLTIRFQNILTSYDFGYDKTGSVVVYGEVEYCYKPCSLAPPTESAEEKDEKDRCSQCDPDSTLTLQFENMETVLLKELSLSPLGENVHGHCNIQTHQVETFSVEGGAFQGVEHSLGPESGCWGWQERVNCTQVLEVGEGVREASSSIAGAVCGGVAAVLFLLVVVGVIAGARVKEEEE